ncbi:hypothetical protein ACLOJK_006899 [Asimina triloba]
MDHHSSGTKRFLLEPISPFIFPNPSVVIFVHQQAPHQQIHAIHHVHKIEPVPKLSGPHPTNGEDRLPMRPHDARPSHLVRMLLDRTRHRLARPLPHSSATATHTA